MNATQWTVQWSIALLPPQEMVLPASTHVLHTPHATAYQLFGFFPAPDWEAIVMPEHVQQIITPEDTDDTITRPAPIEFVAFV